MKTEIAVSVSMSSVVVVAFFNVGPAPAAVESLIIYTLLAAGIASLIALKLRAPVTARFLIFLQCGGLIAAAFPLQLTPLAVFLTATAALILACHCLDLQAGRKSFLTIEQQQIIYLAVAKDLTNKAIAFEMGRGAGSIGRKLSEIYRKLDLDSRSGLINWYRTNHIQRARIRHAASKLRREGRAEGETA